jgi:hypothetical protein
MIDAKWRQSVIKVGGGRGFLMMDDQENLVVVTAAHCLPHLPPSTAASYTEERTYERLLGRLGDEPSIAAEVLFVDPVADIAILGTPDNQEMWEQAEAYDALVDVPPVPMAALEFGRKTHPLQNGQTFLGHLEAEADAWLLALPCRVNCHRGIWISDADRPTVGGMSGSPIVTQSGAIGILSLSASTGSDDDGHREGGPKAYLPLALPGWMLAR